MRRLIGVPILFSDWVFIMSTPRAAKLPNPSGAQDVVMLKPSNTSHTASNGTHICFNAIDRPVCTVADVALVLDFTATLQAEILITGEGDLVCTQVPQPENC